MQSLTTCRTPIYTAQQWYGKTEPLSLSLSLSSVQIAHRGSTAQHGNIPPQIAQRGNTEADIFLQHKFRSVARLPSAQITQRSTSSFSTHCKVWQHGITHLSSAHIAQRGNTESASFFVTHCTVWKYKASSTHCTASQRRAWHLPSLHIAQRGNTEPGIFLGTHCTAWQYRAWYLPQHTLHSVAIQSLVSSSAHIAQCDSTFCLGSSFSTHCTVWQYILPGIVLQHTLHSVTVHSAWDRPSAHIAQCDSTFCLGSSFSTHCTVWQYILPGVVLQHTLHSVTTRSVTCSHAK